MKFVIPDDCIDTGVMFIEDEHGVRLKLPPLISIRVDPPIERGLAVGNLGDIVYEELKSGSKTVKFAGGELTLDDPRRSGTYIDKQ